MKSIMRCDVDGAVHAPPSKSVMGRAVALALLAEGKSVLRNPSLCEDSRSALRVAWGLGANVSIRKGRVEVEGSEKPLSDQLDCGESGLCMRMFAPIAAIWANETTLNARGSLRARPVGMVEAPLRALGAKCSSKEGLPPLKISGPMHGGEVEVDGSTSSQLLSGLLIALPLCRENSRVRTNGLKSKPYVRITLAMLKEAGVEISASDSLEQLEIPGGQKPRASDSTIEGDWSGAAFMLVAGAIAGRVEVNGLDMKSHQADRAIIQALENAGATVSMGKDSATAECNELRGFEFDAGECPDLLPPLAALAINCRGRTTLAGAGRLVHKESNRAQALLEELGKLGAKIMLEGDNMLIDGCELDGGIAHSRNDHRIAMACAVAGLRSRKGVKVLEPECVSKSYPAFFSDLEILCKNQNEVKI